MADSRRRTRLLLIAAAMAFLGGGTAAASPPSLPWESGDFANLPLWGSGDLVTYVDSLSHPTSYRALSVFPGRQAKVEAMFDAIQTAITVISGKPKPGSSVSRWCVAVAAAGDAGYGLGRYYDTVSQRWFLVGADSSGAGQQAYFFINPEPRRDLVIEAPHVYGSNSRLEGRTDTEGALLLRQTLGRALLINGADRCQGGDTPCDGSFTSSQVCDNFPNGGKYRQSDVGHNLDNAFYVLHRKLNDVSASTRFVQLHGNTDTDLPNGGISVSDGRKGPPGLATPFATAIPTVSELPASSVNNCTSGPNILCGYQNVEGRYTNGAANPCISNTLQQGSARFLHLEQRSPGCDTSLIDDLQPVSDALQAIFPCPGCSLSAQLAVVPNPGACP